MFGDYNSDNPFVLWVFKTVDLIFASVLWILFCIPVFTAGASTCALYYTIQKTVKNSRGGVWLCFWDSFKENFKKASLINLIFIAVAFICLLDIAAVRTLGQNNPIVGYSVIFFSVVMVIMCAYAFWVWAYMARFKSDIKGYLKNACVMAIMHFPVTIMIIVIGAAFILLFWLMKPVIIVTPAISVWFMSVFTEKVFRRYMTEEDKRLEDELNMEWHNDYEKKPSDYNKKRK